MFRNVELNKNTATFEIYNVDLSVVNAIRRTILTDIPAISFRGEDEPSLEIIKNNGPLHNEILLHRFGLIPIHFNEEETESFNPDDYEFELNVENNGNNMINVTTNDINIRKNGNELTSKEKQRLLPYNSITKDYILITRLRSGEHLHVRGKAVQGTSRLHAGFSPVSLCTFSFIQDSVLSSQVSSILDKERAYQRNEYGDPTAYKFEIECESGLRPKYLVTKVFEIIQQKLEKTIIELHQEPSDYVSYGPSEKGVGYDFVFQNEDDTYGNLLQSLMFNHYLRDKKPTERGHHVTYVGYVCPHPLESVMILNIVIDGNATVNDYVEALTEQCRRIQGELQNIMKEWQMLEQK